MALKTKTYRLDDTLIEAITEKATGLDISESEVVRKALICFLGIKFDNDCAAYDAVQQLQSKVDGLQQMETRFDALLKHLKVTTI